MRQNRAWRERWRDGSEVCKLERLPAERLLEHADEGRSTSNDRCLESTGLLRVCLQRLMSESRQLNKSLESRLMSAKGKCKLIAASGSRTFSRFNIDVCSRA